MDAQMFQKHALRTWDKEMSNELQLSVLSMGITDELGEVLTALAHDDSEEACFEIGDVFFYCANLYTLLGEQMPEKEMIALTGYTGLDPEHYEQGWILQAFASSAQIAGVVKKHVGQGHELDKELIFLGLSGVVLALTVIATARKIPLKTIFEENHLKLMKRYPNGFEAARSINRDE